MSKPQPGALATHLERHAIMAIFSAASDDARRKRTLLFTRHEAGSCVVSRQPRDVLINHYEAIFLLKQAGLFQRPLASDPDQGLSVASKAFPTFLLAVVG